jgi:hypothetical protein
MVLEGAGLESRQEYDAESFDEFETSRTTNRTAWRHIPEYGNPQNEKCLEIALNSKTLVIVEHTFF